MNHLYKKIQNLHAQAKDLQEQAAKEDRQLTAEEMTSFEKYFEEITGIEKQLDLAKRMTQFEASAADPFLVSGKPTGENLGEVSARFDKSFEKWMRNGPKSLTEEERAILNFNENGAVQVGVTTEERKAIMKGIEQRTSALANPTYFAPISLAAQFAATQKAIGPWMDACTVINTATGETMYMPYFNDAGNDGSIESEGTDAIGSSTDLTAARQQLDSYWYSSTGVAVGWSTLRDSSYPVNEFIVQPLMNRLMREISDACTAGGGSSAPNGIADAAVVGELTSKNTTPTATDMNNLLTKVDYAYHNGPKSGWMFNSNTMFKLAATVKSTTYNTEPLWQPSLAAGIPGTLYGYKYWINNSMSSIAGTTAKVMLFGDFSYFVIRYAGPLIISRLEERYAETGKVGFLVSQYVDSEVRVVGTTYAPFKYIRTLGS